MIPEDWTGVESTQIARVKFERNKHDACGTFRVEFTTGKVYNFKEVPEFRTEGLVHASSPYTYYRNFIVGQYEVEKGE